MEEVEITRASMKGQVVIPESIRKRLHIIPGTKFAKEAGINSEKDVERMIHEARGVK